MPKYTDDRQSATVNAFPAPPVPPGTYEVWVETVEEKTSTLTGRTYYLLTCGIRRGPHAGRVVFAFLVTFSRGTFMWDRAAEHPTHMEGHAYDVRIRVDQYNEKMRNRVGPFVPVGQSFDPIDWIDA